MTERPQLTSGLIFTRLEGLHGGPNKKNGRSITESYNRMHKDYKVALEELLMRRAMMRDLILTALRISELDELDECKREATSVLLRWPEAMILLNEKDPGEECPLSETPSEVG